MWFFIILLTNVVMVIKPRGRNLVGNCAGLVDVRSAYQFRSESLERREYFGNLVFKARIQGSCYSGVNLGEKFVTVSHRLGTS
jgi:hypothetical protein